MNTYNGDIDIEALVELGIDLKIKEIRKKYVKLMTENPFNNISEDTEDRSEDK